MQTVKNNCRLSWFQILVPGLVCLSVSGCMSLRDKAAYSQPTEALLDARHSELAFSGQDPEIIAVLEKYYNNALVQDIYLQTDGLTKGENFISVRLFGFGREYVMRRLDRQSATRTDFAAEMKRVLPGVSMVQSALYADNHYGPYGYATGKGSGSDLCIYAWQFIKSPGPRALIPFAFQTSNSVQIRLRYCAPGASEANLRDIFENWTFVSSPLSRYQGLL